MSSIKNLRSGSVPDTKDSNPDLPAGDYTLDFGHVDARAAMMKQANSTHAVVSRAPAGIKKGQ